MEKKHTVIYIISDRRSGSTLLENVLSKSSEIVSVGELNTLKGHLLKQGPGERWDWNCACGNPLPGCVFWKPILEKTYMPKKNSFETNTNWNFKSKKLLMAALLPSLFRKKVLSIISNKKNKAVANTIQPIYECVFQQAGKSFIVDSSKDPFQALTLYKSDKNFDVKIIWLKRDIRAIAVSKMKWKELNVKKQKTLKQLLFNVLYFRRLCYAVSGFINKQDIIQMNYEDLAINTQAKLDEITARFNILPYTAPEFMYVENDHTIGGTPNRFSKRPIKYDESWKKEYEQKKFLYMLGGLMNKV